MTRIILSLVLGFIFTIVVVSVVTAAITLLPILLMIGFFILSCLVIYLLLVVGKALYDLENEDK